NQMGQKAKVQNFTHPSMTKPPPPTANKDYGVPARRPQPQIPSSSGYSVPASRPIASPSNSSIASSAAVAASEGVEDNEDTMKNLRKTFAGIFGDM
ncbi:hypothetical protein Ciccas_014237, partial [Cichlidogyrus casuarinus]